MIVVRRYHLALTHAYGIGTQACMDEADDGFYVQHSEHLAEVRQTQRRMIAALYWRAGAIRLACHTHHYASPMWWGSIADSDAILAEAVRMEAACAR